MSEPIYVLGAARTPIGSFQGALAKQSAPALGAHAIQGALANAGVAAGEVNEVIMGNVVSAGLKQAPARQAMRMADMPDAVGATTLNKVCGSGMKATMMAMDLIAAGSADTVIAGGMESMSNAPYLLPKSRAGLRMGHANMQDSLFTDGLEDAETGGSMGSFAQSTADSHQLTRESMDAYAIESVKRALAAIEQDRLAAEILPMDIDGVSVKDDEQPGKAKVDRIPTLRPAFKSDGTITAANASSISDGASALVLTRESNLNGRAPLARIVAHTTHSIHPSEFTLAPIGAIEKLLEKTGWSADSVDLFEINEAFASVPMAWLKDLDYDHEKTNVNGGAIALGHPLGSTGTKLMTTLLHEMERREVRYGLQTMCEGGGQANVTILERL